MSRPLVDSFGVLSTLLAYRIVIADTAGSNNVVYPSAASAAPPLGVTRDTVKDTTTGIPVQLNGRAKVYFNDTMSSGSMVASDSSGRGVKHVDTTAGSYVLGILVGPAISATGTIQDVIINPFFKSIP